MSFITIVVSLVNRGVESGIDRFDLTLITEGKEYKPQSIPTKKVIFNRPEFDRFGLPVTDEGIEPPYEDLEKSKGEPRKRGHIFKGWLRFAVKDIFLRKEMNCRLQLTVIDAFGRSNTLQEIKPVWNQSGKTMTVIELGRNQ